MTSSEKNVRATQERHVRLEKAFFAISKGSSADLDFAITELRDVNTPLVQFGNRYLLHAAARSGFLVPTLPPRFSFDIHIILFLLYYFLAELTTLFFDSLVASKRFFLLLVFIRYLLGDTNLVKTLIDKGANVALVEDWFGYTALHEAAICGHLAIVKLLLKHGKITTHLCLVNLFFFVCAYRDNSLFLPH